MAQIKLNPSDPLSPEPPQIRGTMSQLQLHLEAGTLILRNQPLEITLTVLSEGRKLEVSGDPAPQANPAKKSCS